MADNVVRQLHQLRGGITRMRDHYEALIGSIRGRILAILNAIPITESNQEILAETQRLNDLMDAHDPNESSDMLDEAFGVATEYARKDLRRITPNPPQGDLTEAEIVNRARSGGKTRRRKRKH